MQTIEVRRQTIDGQLWFSKKDPATGNLYYFTTQWDKPPGWSDNKAKRETLGHDLNKIENLLKPTAEQPAKAPPAAETPVAGENQLDVANATNTLSVNATQGGGGTFQFPWVRLNA